MTSTALAAAQDPARLGTVVTPRFEAMRFDLDADQKSYSGSATIELEVHAPTDSLRFHARDLKLERVTLRRGQDVIPTTTRRGDLALVTVEAKQALAPGSYTLIVDFANDFNTRANG